MSDQMSIPPKVPPAGPTPAVPLRDPLFSLLRYNLIGGAAVGLAFVAGVLILDLGRIRSLTGFSPDGVIALLLLTLGGIVTFASVAMGSAIMMIGRKDAARPNGPGKSAPQRRGRLIPALARRPPSPRARG